MFQGDFRIWENCFNYFNSLWLFSHTELQYLGRICKNSDELRQHTVFGNNKRIRVCATLAGVQARLNERVWLGVLGGVE